MFREKYSQKIHIIYTLFRCMKKKIIAPKCSAKSIKEEDASQITDSNGPTRNPLSLLPKTEETQTLSQDSCSCWVTRNK